jgi:hypothetical protein
MEAAMRKDPNKFSMGLRGILAALVGGAALVGAAAGAEAGEGHGKKHRHYYYAPGYVMVPPGHVHYYAPERPVVYAPRPVVVYPPPVVYAPAYPAYPAYGPSGGSMSFGLNLPLN